ncbi:MAG: OmpH family outer membrane protein [Gammaproteobacteria bacterium]|nr:OmpH family outer membrane protein [Gammaproteobacteria bacterium]
MKIGIVNTARILNEAPQVKLAKEFLQKEFSERENNLAKLRDDLKKKEEQLQRDSAIMTDEQRRKLEHELLSGKRDFVRAQNEFREDLNIRQNEIFSKVQQQIQQVIQQMAVADRFDLILEDYVYASGRVDLTARVLQELNNQANGKNRLGKAGK